MKGLHTKGRVALAALLLAASAAAAIPAAPAAASPVEAGSAFAWVGDWLARLLPGWTAAATETEPPPPPTGDGIALDDERNDADCDPTICTEGESLPDFDPDG